MSFTAAQRGIDGHDFGEERAALQRLLSSGIFERSPGLASFLRYVCEMHFDGRSEEIKEYNIAIDALGRRSDFDQKRDSIVRVEAHRLRKRLQDYYAGLGNEEPVQIVIPPGSYAPRFVHRGRTDVVDRSNEEAAVEGPSSPPASTTSAGRLRNWFVLAALLSLGLAIAGWYSAGRSETGAVSSAVVPPAAGAVPSEEIRILSGLDAPRYVDRLGTVWGPDRFFTGGTTLVATPRPIRRTPDDGIYLRQRLGQFRYDIPLRPGAYELRLHFAETIFGEGNVAGGGESSRVFAFRINGGAQQAIDVISDAGGANTADIKVFKDVSPAADGKLHLEFFPFQKEQAFVNAIEILPGLSGKMLPVRLIVRPGGFVDRTKREWSADRFYEGGVQVQRYDTIGGASDPELYQAERYGNFTYSIPVVSGGRYTANLHFCENWFGPGRPGRFGEGARVFNVYCNGRPLLRNFDIFKRAGGALKPVVETFHNLEPNAQGKLVFQFVPVENYAAVNAIEIIDEGR